MQWSSSIANMLVDQRAMKDLKKSSVLKEYERSKKREKELEATTDGQIMERLSISSIAFASFWTERITIWRLEAKSSGATSNVPLVSMP